MGWCSGTEIFDAVAKYVVSTDQPEDVQVNLLLTLADAMEDMDWDCQQDSAYYDHPIVQKVMRSLHPDWFDDEDE